MMFCRLHINALTHQKALRSRQLGTEAQIINRIFNDYNPYIRPPVRDYADHGAIVVITSIHINRIQWHTHVAEIDLYLRQQWEDTRLAYDVDVREGISEIAIPQNRKVWTPDTYFGTANEKPIDDTRRNRIVVEPTGDVRASEQRLVEVGVDNSIAFPFHNQKSFRLRLASYNYPIEDVVYLWANSPPRIVPVETSQELLHGNTYTLTDAYVGDCVGNYTVGVYSCIDVLVTFRGPATAPIFQLFCPSIFLVVFSWLHFWIHGSWSVPRTFSAAIPFLVFTVLIIFFPQPNLTRTGVGATQVWLIGCLFLTFASLLEYFLVICSKSRIRTRPQLQHPGTNDSALLTSTIEGIESQYEGKRSSVQYTSTIDIISRIIFPVIFIVFTICFLIFYVVL
ncbi:hypothetical protein M3Y98_00552300 [Aphelenchoides besseyi]|nr:hypothetical protein M3Y98_00552300 [Aphelenchoides besseyi]